MPELAVLALAGLAGLAIGLVAAAAMLARARRGATPIDVPDERRLHTTPTPRGGGLGVPLAGLAVGAVAAALTGGLDRQLVLVTVGWALPNGVMGYIDDHWPLRSRVKFGLMVAFAVAAAALGLRLESLALPPFGVVELGWLSWPFSVLWLVWNANVFNFMDGMDGLAAGSGILFFGGFALWAAGAGLPGLAAVSIALAGALGGFLRYNVPPAKIFMGDAGSLFIGGALGALALALARPDTAGISVAASTVLMGTFVWDATYTIVRRALRGDPMLPHRTHLYQRLALAGWSHGRVRVLYLGLAVLYAAGALAMPGAGRTGRAGILAAALAVAVGLVLLVRRAERAVVAA